ncbi:hypothetical protein [Marilutibacter aestuarii]|uniref:Uncharacterized protein n=1 Tax=Marilutibacter aestuarii TaxID=1706195 RepID=A0A508AJ05_9GAMM|nr:hypothetical protein [Lysobacter aestuarii]TQD45672.1 hypothetical protein FKV25_07535 [Lysobacter aestuarii]
MKTPPISDAVEHARHAAGRAADSAQAWAGSVGKSLQRTDAAKWLEAGLKIGALRTGARVVGGFARRNPVVAVATVAGAGLLWYAARRKMRERQALAHGDGEAIEGQARRVEARKAKAKSGRGSTRGRSASVTPSSE